MEKIVTGQKNERENHDDQSLTEELESLYCHVAQLDQAESAGEQREALLPGYASAPIPPAAVPSKIRQSNKKYQELPSGNHYQQPFLQDKLTERLEEIADAYEGILMLWPDPSKHPPPAPPGEAFSEILRGETQPGGVGDDRSSTAARYSVLRRYPWSTGSVATMVVVIFMFFVWPTLYHYNSLKVGNKLYPVRINRLTAHLAYFDGKTWLDSPIFEDMASRQAVNSQPLPPHLVITPPSITALPLPVVDNERRYSIQIKAFREAQDAQAFADDLKQKEPGIHIETVILEGSGVWHRILLGNFKTENEALSYFTVIKAKERYPGSFIKDSQKKP
jgi:hypothetical protein